MPGFSSRVPLISHVLVSARPNTWLRIWGEMILGASVFGQHDMNFFRFFLGFLAVSPFVWSAGYILNDLSDVSLDLQHPFRRTRPIPSGHLSPRTATWAIVFLAGGGFLLGAFLSIPFFLFLLLLFLTQVLYTLKPFRLKERMILDIVSNMVNSALRFFLGALTQTSSLRLLAAPFLFVVCLKAALFLGHRVQNKSLERANGIMSTTAVLPSGLIFGFILSFFSLSAFGFLLSIAGGLFPIQALFVPILGVFPFLFRNDRLSTRTFSSQESNSSIRTRLYVSFFLVMNAIAATIIFF